MHLIAWDNLTKPLTEGVLRLLNLKFFNKALLTRQVWRVVTQPTSLLSKLLTTKFGKGEVEDITYNNSNAS